MKHLLMIPALAAGLSWASPATADERGVDFWDRPSVGVPVRFRAANGGSFRPRTLVLRTASGLRAAALPASSDDARSEDRVDFTDVPFIGGGFRQRLAPEDARRGDLLGPVYRLGDTLYVDARDWPSGLTGLPVTLSTHVPQAGSVSYRLGRLSYVDAAVPVGSGRRVGTSYILNGQLVLASPGNGAPSLKRLIESIF